MTPWPLPEPDEDWMLRVTYLGILPVHSDFVCDCGVQMLTMVVGYSFSTKIVSIEDAGFCEQCDTVFLGNGSTSGGFYDDTDPIA